MIGDRGMDIEFAHRVGAKAILVLTGYGRGEWEYSRSQWKVEPDYVQMVRPLTPYNDLSRGLLRVLALVAYKQPITQSDIVKVLGNRAYEYVKKLEGRGLVNTVKHGRTKALVATKEFANYFGLEKTEDLKKLGVKTEKSLSSKYQPDEEQEEE